MQDQHQQQSQQKRATAMSTDVLFMSGATDGSNNIKDEKSVNKKQDPMSMSDGTSLISDSMDNDDVMAPTVTVRKGLSVPPFVHDTLKTFVGGKDTYVSSTVIKTEDGSSESEYVDINIETSKNSGQTPQTVPVICPQINCPEKIIFCLDLNEEMSSTTFRSRAGDKYSGLELAKRAIKMFVLHKNQINTAHEFAFLVFHNESTIIQPFTKSATDILKIMDETDMSPQPSDPLDLALMFQTIKENVSPPEIVGCPTVIPPAYVVRVLLFYGRSHSVPVNSRSKVQRELEASPHFFTDVLYIHEPPSGDNKCEEIFQTLCDLDHNGLSYIFEQSKYTPILNSGAKLLAHPLQRPQQLQATYKIGNGPIANHNALKDEKII